MIEYNQKSKGAMVMYSVKYIRGHIQVFDARGRFLFSADNEREAREELREIA